MCCAEDKAAVVRGAEIVERAPETWRGRLPPRVDLAETHGPFVEGSYLNRLVEKYAHVNVSLIRANPLQESTHSSSRTLKELDEPSISIQQHPRDAGFLVRRPTFREQLPQSRCIEGASLLAGVNHRHEGLICAHSGPDVATTAAIADFKSGKMPALRA